MDDVLGIIDGFSQFLQSEKMDVFTANKSAEAVVETLKKLIHEDDFKSKWEKTNSIANELKDIIKNNHLFNFKEPLLPRNSPQNDIQQFYKESLHDDVIQNAVSEIETCFNKNNQEIICALTTIVMMPQKSDVETEANLVSEFYGLDKASLMSGRKIVATTIELQNKKEVLTATSKLVKWLQEDGIGEVLPSYKVAATILAAIPVTSCSAERSFSALRRIKTYLKQYETRKTFQCGNSQH